MLEYQGSLNTKFQSLINTTVFLGLRSSVIAPHTNLATVIIDDEHHPLYREQRNPHIDATVVAEARWSATGVQLIFASYAPSLQRYHAAQRGAMNLIEAKRGTLTHDAVLIDTRNEAQHTISLALQKAIQETLARNKKVLLLLNRRGLATWVFCTDCKKVCICPHCETPTVFHKITRMLICHYCNFQEPLPLFCPACKNPDLQLRGKGTEKVVEELKELFHHASIARVDLDNPSILTTMADITIGTQMLFTALPASLLSETGLIGVISADTALNMPVLTAPEHTFQLLMHTLVLSASYHIPVMVQTMLPEHYAILNALSGNAAGFTPKSLA